MSQALRVIHDYWGAVAPIRGRGARARHVWQHLYNQVELWDALIGRAVEPLVLESIRMGCPAPQPGDANHRPRLSLVSDRCLSVLHRHHQKHYSPAYMEQLGQPNTRWARQRIREDRLLCCTPRGVLVSVGLRPPVSVVTAFRPDLPFDGVPDDDDFFQEALSRWSRGVAMDSTSPWGAALLSELEAASARKPSRPAEAWRFARALGHARSLSATEAALLPVLTRAEAFLAVHRSGISKLLADLPCQRALDGLEKALAEAEGEAVQDALLMIEDLLVVAGVLGFERAANELLDEARELVSFWPVELTGFERLVDARSQQVSGFAWFFWASVEEAALAAQMMDASPPALLPEATLVGAVLPTPEIFGWVLSRLEQMKQSLSAPPLASVQRVALARCAALGDGEGPEFDARVEGSCPAGAALSVFIVDRDHRHGERMIEGEDYQRRGEAWMLEGWRLSGWEDDALVVAVVSSEPLDGDNLEQVLDAAMAREDVIVTEAWLRPASTRRP